MPDGPPRAPGGDPWTPVSTLPPTAIETATDEATADFARTAKYPVRKWAVLSPEQLAATRARLGHAGFVPPKTPNRREQDRRPLTRDELLDVRARRIVDQVVGDDL